MKYQDKMAAILADDMFLCIFLNKNFWISKKKFIEIFSLGWPDNEQKL